MEDRDTVVQHDVGGRAVTFLGVYDGHGGAQVADLAAVSLDRHFFDGLHAGRAPADAMSDAYRDVAVATTRHAHVGSTASTAVLVGTELTAAWVGDSQILVATGVGVRFFAPPHRLDDPTERARVVAAGAEIDGKYVMRGEYGLMVTRAFGDIWFEPVGVVAAPSIATLDLDPRRAHLIVLASDGLWDVIPPDAVAELFATHERTEGFDYARTLVDGALAAATRDNVTVVTAEWRSS